LKSPPLIGAPITQQSRRRRSRISGIANGRHVRAVQLLRDTLASGVITDPIAKRVLQSIVDGSALARREVA
jgi:hypothetical protein